LSIADVASKGDLLTDYTILRELFVFFSTAPWMARKRRKQTLAQRLRIARRFPRRTMYVAVTRFAKFVSRSDIAHVAVGYDGAVLDQAIAGGRFWPFEPFLCYYPCLIGVFVVPIRTVPDLDRHYYPGRNPIWPTFMRWWTFGRVQTRDCVCITVTILRDAEYIVPRNVVTPIQLYNWLKTQGFEYVPLR
jgi:hypothetical protein